MDYIVAIKRNDGNVSIMHFNKSLADITELYCNQNNGVEEVSIEDLYKWQAEQNIARLDQKLKDSIVSYRLINTDQLPKDRTFRTAWTDDFATDTVDVDMDKAKDIHMSRIREARNAKFLELGFPNKLDDDLEKAIIPESTRNKLQILRDLPANIDLDAATNPEELNAIWPEELR